MSLKEYILFIDIPLSIIVFILVLVVLGKIKKLRKKGHTYKVDKGNDLDNYDEDNCYDEDDCYEDDCYVAVFNDWYNEEDYFDIDIEKQIYKELPTWLLTGSYMQIISLATKNSLHQTGVTTHWDAIRYTKQSLDKLYDKLDRIIEVFPEYEDCLAEFKNCII